MDSRIGVLGLPVEVRTFPPEDQAFQSLVAEHLRRFDRTRTVDAIPGRLSELLRPAYPAARCVLQSPLAIVDRRVLYAYRDGAAVAVSQPPAADQPLLVGR
jgi:hypothetical protein